MVSVGDSAEAFAEGGDERRGEVFVECLGEFLEPSLRRERAHGGGDAPHARVLELLEVVPLRRLERHLQARRVRLEPHRHALLALALERLELEVIRADAQIERVLEREPVPDRPRVRVLHRHLKNRVRALGLHPCNGGHQDRLRALVRGVAPVRGEEVGEEGRGGFERGAEAAEPALANLERDCAVPWVVDPTRGHPDLLPGELLGPLPGGGAGAILREAHRERLERGDGGVARHLGCGHRHHRQQRHGRRLWRLRRWLRLLLEPIDGCIGKGYRFGMERSGSGGGAENSRVGAHPRRRGHVCRSHRRGS
mmetsp:Transcript_29496/g.96052  ORF Transcript_29496/g.96052 Transcript_29496/m.96052 type:complete len:310 (-) Transcript_29496:1480-2409(-)